MDKLYADFSLNFLRHPITGDVSMVTNEKSINQALRNIALRDTYETPFRKTMAGNIRGLLFELATPFVGEDARTRLKDAIETYEPRIELQTISARWDEPQLKLWISIVYTARTSTEEISLDFYLDRVV